MSTVSDVLSALRQFPTNSERRTAFDELTVGMAPITRKSSSAGKNLARRPGKVGNPTSSHEHRGKVTVGSVGSSRIVEGLRDK
ncbi:hypothetical protein ACFWGD_00685 [Corynebacterium sp. NPDC060344]|uniref:hypothetical protein n=1 Tax=Corynebacterium sp. NPDC060344 TaxID=3347101 RepID=UPI003657A156